MHELSLFFEHYIVRIQIHSNRLQHLKVQVTRKEFDKLVRNPRMFDYVNSVSIQQKKKKYFVTIDNVKTAYVNVADNSILSELITYQDDFTNQFTRLLNSKGLPYLSKNVAVRASEATPAPTCIWTVPRLKVMLGVEKQLAPPEIIGNMHGCPIVDRTGVVAFSTEHVRTDHPMPDFSVKETRSLSHLMLDRAEELWQWIEDEGRMCTVWWSGGIDSTALLVAMIKTSTPDRVRLIQVGLNQRSIEEYPSFHEKYVKRLPCIFVNHSDGTNIDLNSLHITGEIGDQLFGSDYLRSCFGGGGVDFPGRKHFLGALRKPWQDSVSPFVKDQLAAKDLPATHHTALMETYELLNSTSPLEINSVFDFWWWSNFNLKYTHVSNRLQLNAPNAALANERIKAFFDTPTFQRWSVNNHDIKIGDTWKSYKRPLKNFVFKFYKDKNWRDNKLKVQSLRMGVSDHILMDSNYQCFGIADKEKLINTYFGGVNDRS